MGTSGAAPSAERDPDSLEREDDSFFPACLLELFLSHISPAKSLLFFFLCLSSSQSMTHDLSVPLWEHCGQIGNPSHPQKPAKSPNLWDVLLISCDCHFAEEQVQKEAFTSSVQSNLSCVAATLPLHSHRSIGLLLWFVSIFILCKVLLCCSLPCQTHTHWHTGYISI